MFRYVLTFGLAFVCVSGAEIERNNKRIERRLRYIEDVIAEERLQRREDVQSILEKLSGLDHKLQKTSGSKLANTLEQDEQIHETIAQKISEIIIKRLARGFADEKLVNARFRREIENKLRNEMNSCSPIPLIVSKLQSMEECIDNIDGMVSTELNKLQKIYQQNSAIKSDLADAKTEITYGQSQLSNNITEILLERMRLFQTKHAKSCSLSNTTHNMLFNGQQILDGEGNKDGGDNIEKGDNKDGVKKPVIKQYGSCKELYEAGYKTNGVYSLAVKDRIEDVYCDQTTDDGGWIVFQRRQDGSEDFNRNWNDYKRGFGDSEGEFWLGNDNLSDLTENCCHELRVDIGDFDGNMAYAKYSDFRVLNEASLYKLEVGSYTGNAGNSLGVHNNMKFSTKDSDNDASSGYACTDLYPGAWWFKECYQAHLNGMYHQGGKAKHKGVHWVKWRKLIKDSYSLRFSEMKFRKE